MSQKHPHKGTKSKFDACLTAILRYMVYVLHTSCSSPQHEALKTPVRFSNLFMQCCNLAVFVVACLCRLAWCPRSAKTGCCRLIRSYSSSCPSTAASILNLISMVRQLANTCEWRYSDFEPRQEKDASRARRQKLKGSQGALLITIHVCKDMLRAPLLSQRSRGAPKMGW